MASAFDPSTVNPDALRSLADMAEASGPGAARSPEQLAKAAEVGAWQ